MLMWDRVTQHDQHCKGERDRGVEWMDERQGWVLNHLEQLTNIVSLLGIGLDEYVVSSSNKMNLGIRMNSELTLQQVVCVRLSV